jgi:hypothetical protein
LASNAGSYITGETIVLDGGITAGASSGRLPQGVYDVSATVLRPELAGYITPSHQRVMLIGANSS